MQLLESQTKQHYDSYPFDAITLEDERKPREIQPKPFIEFCEKYLSIEMTIVEVGCGPGRATMYLRSKGIDVTGIDISVISLQRARKRSPGAHFVQATTMALPLRDNAFNAVISDGVIHHTPDARVAFGESVRVLRDGGYFYLGIYNRRRFYYYIYTYVGRPVRWLAKSYVGRVLLSATLIPLYYVAHLTKSRGKRTLQGAKNFFYDYIITPKATFHTRAEVAKWAVEFGLELIRYDPSLGNVHVFVFQKPTCQKE